MRALVLSGGGCKGAWQAGVLSHLLTEESREYSIICGISVGALNGAYLAQYSTGQGHQAAFDLLDLWRSLDTSKVYKRWWPFGVLHGLTRGSAYNSSPLHRFVREHLDPTRIRLAGKQLRVGAVSMTTGEYRLFGETYTDLPGAVLASSAFPAMLCPVELEGQLWSDGGVKEITPLKAAINLGATSIDVIVCSPVSDGSPLPAKPNALHVAARALDFMSDEILSNDLDQAALVNRLVRGEACSDRRDIDIRVFRPAAPLASDSLDFSPSKLKSLILRGQYDALGGGYKL